MQGGGGLYKAINCDKFAANKDKAYNYYFKAGVLRCFLIFSLFILLLNYYAQTLQKTDVSMK